MIYNLSTKIPFSSTSDELQERRSFDFFRTEVVPTVSGHFGARTWELVLQACSREPVVIRAAVALGSLYEASMIESENGGSRCIATSFPARQYKRALGHLRQYLTQNNGIDSNVVLICALIHMSIEVIQNNYVDALMHLENSLQLMKAYAGPRMSRLADPERDIDSELIDTFHSLDIHASSFQGMRLPAFTDFWTKTAIPGRFSGLKESHLTLNRIRSHLSYFTRSIAEEYKYRKLKEIPFEAIAEAASIRAEFSAWDERFQKYLHRSTSKFSRADQIVIDILLISHRLGTIEAATCIHDEATFFDHFDAVFEEIVILAANVIRARKSSRVLDFQQDIGVIQPLYRTAVMCRELWTRQKAIALLKSIKFQEGVWNASAQVAIAQVAIDRENAFNDVAGVADRPMEFARVHSVGTVIDPVKRVAEVILTQRLNGLDGPWHEHVEWCSW